MLSFFAPDHEIFDKSYVFKRETEAAAEFELYNEDNLFTNLPLADERTIKSTKRLRLPKDQVIELRLKKLDV